MHRVAPTPHQPARPSSTASIARLTLTGHRAGGRATAPKRRQGVLHRALLKSAKARRRAEPPDAAASDHFIDVEDLYQTKKVHDRSLSKKGKKGGSPLADDLDDLTVAELKAQGAVYVTRPVLSLSLTKIEGRRAENRRAFAVVGYDEGAGSQLAGAFEVYLGGECAGIPATWSQLRTAADAELVHDARPAHLLGGLLVIYDSYRDELLPEYHPTPKRERRVTDPPAPGFVTVGGTWAKTKQQRAPRPPRAYVELPCPLCDNQNYGVEGRLCERHWKADYKANLRTFEKLSLTSGNEPIDEDAPTLRSNRRGIPADPTGDSATARADTGEVDGLIRDELLTPSEARVIELRAAGWNLHEIGREMGTAASTVAEHLKRAQRKLTPRRRRLTWRGKWHARFPSLRSDASTVTVAAQLRRRQPRTPKRGRLPVLLPHRAAWVDARRRVHYLLGNFFRFFVDKCPTCRPYRETRPHASFFGRGA